MLCNGDKNGKVVWNPYPRPDHDQKLTTSRGSPLADAYHVWSTSLIAIVSYPAHTKTGRTTDHIRRPASVE